MKWFAYADQKIGGKEVIITVPSMLIGGGILALPSELAKETIGSDGWVIILSGGLIIMLFIWLIAKLTSRFPHQPFFKYATTIASKPVAIILTILFAIVALLLTSYMIRNIANTAKEYLFEQTPIEVISLTFLLVVVYAVTSSRIGLFRLNMLFFPFLIILIILILLFNLKWFDINNLLPVFQTNPQSYIKSMSSVLPSYVGIFIFFFYLAFLERPKEAPKMVVLGVCIPIVLYLIVFVTCIGVFGNAATADMLNPTIELAKRAEIPGGILERMEIVFYATWLMAVFNTSALGFDIAILALQSILKKTEKIRIILIASPVVYLINMLPQNYIQLDQFGRWISYMTFTLTVSVVVGLLVITKLRGVKHSGEKKL